MNMYMFIDIRPGYLKTISVAIIYLPVFYICRKKKNKNKKLQQTEGEKTRELVSQKLSLLELKINKFQKPHNWAYVFIPMFIFSYTAHNLLCLTILTF